MYIKRVYLMYLILKEPESGGSSYFVNSLLGQNNGDARITLWVKY